MSRLRCARAEVVSSRFRPRLLPQNLRASSMLRKRQVCCPRDHSQRGRSRFLAKKYLLNRKQGFADGQAIQKRSVGGRRFPIVANFTNVCVDRRGSSRWPARYSRVLALQCRRRPASHKTCLFLTRSVDHVFALEGRPLTSRKYASHKKRLLRTTSTRPFAGFEELDD